MTTIEQKNIGLQGIITVDDFDSTGNPVRFVLLTDDENKYILEHDTKNPDIDFSRYARSKVHLTGAVRFGHKRRVITVSEVKVLLCSDGAHYKSIV
nr:hypothetical protein [Desulfobulbaceae bacterium]